MPSKSEKQPYRLRHIGLFEGMGGFSLAAQWAGWETIAWCEINPFGQQVLRYWFPEAKEHNDVTKTDFSIYEGRCNVLTGGFPCQGFSLAGRRMGTEDARYLWPEMLRGIDEAQPTWVVAENVTGLLSMEDRTGARHQVFAKVVSRKITRYCKVDHYEAVYTRQAKMLIGSICEDLEERGYEVQSLAIPAAGVGAPHKRERVWIVAYRSDAGFKGLQRQRSNRIHRFESTAHTQKTDSQHAMLARSGQHGTTGMGCVKDAAYFPQKRQQSSLPGNKEFQSQKGSRLSSGNGDKQLSNCVKDATHADSQRHARQKYGETKSRQSAEANSGQRWQAFPTQSPVCSRDDGFPGQLVGLTFSKWRNESIEALGNAIVPQVAYQIFQGINEVDYSPI